ncbi:cocaine esterase [Colletotrichum spaethianum]|uniref:Carboxylic ester hydrolase n=1 Tax=Colletotrichum spaethianum TaxID=700344 RepID=A0AA37PAQ4_9PEZI|nr:cocaine esterase [Colletotrichum spaethianum]GKT48724.1 cocaine esterase [Colletotrichum spaethianum]
MGNHRQSLFAQVLLSSTFFLGAFGLPASNAGPSVTISSGVIIGTTAQPASQAGSTGYANAYLGVPFAKSPPERFSPPESAPSWSTPLPAQAFRPACIQQFTDSGNAQVLQKQYFGNPTGPLPEESEDCLYLNVFAPPSASSSNKKAVMFWLFPGNLQFGTASLPIYDGSSLAIAQDVVVVTINYRTNIFGFSNSPEVATGSQNSGYLDQRFALQWVQDNIVNFGGDPSRVTIFGESAGLLASPPSPLPFSAAIMQSQQSLLIGSGSDSYKKVLQQFKCQSESSPIACLRKVPAADIKAYIESAALVFPPVNGDGTSVSDVRGSITSKKWPKIPVLIGTTLNEARVFLAVETAGDGTSAMDATMSKIGVTSTNTKNSILAQYSAKGMTDIFLASNGYTAYRYRYDASFPSTSIFANSGAYHTSEIPSVFGTYPEYNKFGSATQQQIKLSSYMQGVWGGFAKKPTGGVGWPKVGGALGFELGLLGASGSSGVSVVASLTADYPCLAYSALTDMAGLSY